MFVRFLIPRVVSGMVSTSSHGVLVHCAEQSKDYSVTPWYPKGLRGCDLLVLAPTISPPFAQLVARLIF